MKYQIIILVGIIALSLIGIVLIGGKGCDESVNIRRILMDVFLVVLGFLLAICWDVYKDYRTDQKERKAIILILKNETSSIYGSINTNLETIDANQKLLKENKEVLRPLIPLKIDGWTSAQLRNTVFLENTADLVRFVHLYTAISIANEKIKSRESYRMLGYITSDYLSRLSKIDLDVKQCLEKTLPLLKEAQDVLDRVYNWKVEGPSFQIENNGVVKETGKPSPP